MNENLNNVYGFHSLEVRCANCNDLIDTVDDNYQLGLFQHKVWINGDLVIVDTGGCEVCKYGSGI